MLEEKFRGKHSAPRRRKKRGGGIIVALVICAALVAAGLFAVSCFRGNFKPSSPAVTPESRPAEEVSSEITPEITEEPPVEEAPAESLRDKDEGRPIKVWVNGQSVLGLLINGTSYVSAEDITACLPDFTWQGESGRWSFTGTFPNSYDDPPALSCAEYGVAEEGGGICCGKEYWLPLRFLSDSFGARLMWESESKQAYITFTPHVDIDKLRGYEIPILMYHAVSDDIWGMEGLFVSPSSMREQLEYLRDNGYDPIFFSDLAHIEDYDKPVLLTFDDGYLDNYEELFPLLKEYNTKATVFVVSGALGIGHTMTAANAKEMADSGLVDIQSHTADHYELASLDYDGQEDQLARSQKELARATKRIPYVLAYPNGGHNDVTKEIGAKYYDFGILKDGGVWYPNDDRFAVTRLRVDRSHGISAFAAMLE